MKILSKKQVYEYLENSKDDKFCIQPINKRSRNQNSYLWWMHTKASEATGYNAKEMNEESIECLVGSTKYTKEQLHKLTTAFFLETKSIEFQGQIVEVMQSTSDLDKPEFSDYLIKVREFYENTFDLYLPDYNEFSLMEGKHL